MSKIEELVQGEHEKKVQMEETSSLAEQLWKEVISIFFKEFMELCCPDIYKDISWQKGYSIFQQKKYKYQLVGGGAEGIGNVIKVWARIKTKKGSKKQEPILLHFKLGEENRDREMGMEVNVKGDVKEEIVKKLEKVHGGEFATRMWRYYCYLSVRFEIQVVPLGILVDNDPSWRPDLYEYECLGCKVKLKYPILKILDYQKQKDKLMDSDNAFAVVILCQLAALESRDNDVKRKELKLSLTKAVYDKEWPSEKRIPLLKFIDGMLRLPEPIELQFIEEVKAIEKEA